MREWEERERRIREGGEKNEGKGQDREKKENKNDK